MGGKWVLLVEGVDDEHVMKHICGNRGLPPIEEIKPHGGVDELVRSFPVRLKESDIEALGVVIDANSNITSRWESVRNPLIEKGYAGVPEDPSPEGTVIGPPPNTILPRVGVWIMPDNRTPGILEDFLRFLVPESSALLNHAEASVAGIPADERRFAEKDKPKALIHTYLAWQEEPGRPLGTAITARFLDPDVPQVDVLVGWLTRLFAPEAK